jgi:tetrachlorobenzoquinone reductase
VTLTCHIGTDARLDRTTGEGTIRVRVKSITWETADTIALLLTPVDSGWLPDFEPGAHLDLHSPDGAVRQYSISSSHLDTSTYRLGVRVVVAGVLSSFIQRTLRVGEVVTVSRPRNTFRFDASDRYLFVAGGIGITRLIPMIRTAQSRGAVWRLLFCNRNLRDAPFLEEPQSLKGDVSLYTSDLGTSLNIANTFAQVQPNTLIYCCGPAKLMTEIERATAHWPVDSVRFEWFVLREPSTEHRSEAFEVFCRRSNRSVMVQANQSIIDALATAGVDIPKSCEQGICGACEVQVIEGEVDHQDSILAPAERSSAKSMVICVSRARGHRLVLDI